ncbi:MAG: phosphodiester glycosidase family protein [Ignavibacteriales bacterium]|nr:phosphodiester glycosidase family protein [Ignavibacteriales bacterium]
MLQRIRVALAFFLAITWTGSAGLYQTSLPSLSPREKYEVVSSREVRPGVTYYYIAGKRGPWRIHVLEIDLHHSELEIAAARALDKLFGREPTSSIARRHDSNERTVVAALNADFFDLATGENENNNVVETEFVKGTEVTKSPNDVFDNIHSQFAVSISRKPFLDRFAFMGRVFWTQGIASDLHGVNDAPRSNSLVLFNHYYGPSTPIDTLKMDIKELPLREIRKDHDTSYAIVTGKVTSVGTTIGAGMLVLSGYNLQNPNLISSANVGDTVRIWVGTNPDRGTLKTLVGGWPRIVLNGKNIGASVDSIEGTFPRFSAQRNPRSGVGFSMDSTTVYFLVVDGRQPSSAGMTLVEFADLMISQGVYQGLNLDGGGSTTFVLEGRIMNSPSDATGERPVGNCLLLTAPKQK